MKKEYQVSLEDQRLKAWLEEKSEQGIAVAKLEKAAGIPPGILARLLKGERKQLDEHRDILLKHLRSHFYYDVFEKSFIEDNNH